MFSEFGIKLCLAELKGNRRKSRLIELKITYWKKRIFWMGEMKCYQIKDFIFLFCYSTTRMLVDLWVYMEKQSVDLVAAINNLFLVQTIHNTYTCLKKVNTYFCFIFMNGHSKFSKSGTDKLQMWPWTSGIYSVV